MKQAVMIASRIDRGVHRDDPVLSLSGTRDCDRTVISQVRNLEEHRGLLTHTE
jgi:hypothetical protein